MRRSFGVFCSMSIVATVAGCSGSKGAGSGEPAQGSVATSTIASPAASASPKMIVLLRDQLPSVNPGRGAHRLRASAIASAQAPILANLQASAPRDVRSFEMVNGFATSLSKAEVDRLTADPRVLAVVPDRMIAGRAPSPGRSRPTVAVRTGDASAPATRPAPLCNTLEPEALQLTNTAFLDPAIPQAQEVRDGNGERVTGKGVKVGMIAGGLDTTLLGFTRPDGSNVFIDYQNFSGDPATAPVAGSSEMFGDAATIAAQDMPNGRPLEFDISPFAVAPYALPTPCNIRVRGMAPGASLVAIDISSDFGYRAFESTWVQAIDWVVVHDDVDVLNESFGYTLYPDDPNDPISLANAAAVRAGITVVVAAGDAGSNDTLGAPAIDTFVIAVGATTQFRLYQQIDMNMFPLAGGYVDGNVSALSSGGFGAATPRTVDLVAPGDQGWSLCSTNQAQYPQCADFTGAPSPIQTFGGTSEATPITSGAAALVIQAYRSTHGGASPSPATVKSILMSSATDLGAPSNEQGAGVVNTLKAVNTALSVQDEQGAPRASGDGVVISPNSAMATVQTGHGLSQTFQITNTGGSALDLRPALEALAPPFAGATVGLNLESDAPSFVNGYGDPEPYVEHTFTVPAGADHLDAAIAWDVAGDEPEVEFILLDPSGRQAAYSIPQGTWSGYGHADVVSPAPGTWTVAVGTSSSPAYSGSVKFTWSVERFAPVGEVSPSSLTVARGATATVTATLDGRAQPGDFAAALRLHGQRDVALSEIPFTLRSLIPVDATGGRSPGRLREETAATAPHRRRPTPSTSRRGHATSPCPCRSPTSPVGSLDTW